MRFVNWPLECSRCFPCPTKTQVPIECAELCGVIFNFKDSFLYHKESSMHIQLIGMFPKMLQAATSQLLQGYARGSAVGSGVVCGSDVGRLGSP